MLGEELRLQFNYVGVPAPSIQWFHNGVLLRNGVDGVSVNTDDNFSGILIHAVEPTDGGTYTCRANNSLGTDQESYSVAILGTSNYRRAIILQAGGLAHFARPLLYRYLNLNSTMCW